MLEQIYGTIMDVQQWLAAIHLQQICGFWWIMECNHKSGFSWTSCLIKLGSMDLYPCVSRVPVFCNLVGASCSKKAFTRDRQTIPKWLANSHRLPQHAGRRNEGSPTSNTKYFLAKRSCLCSWHTGVSRSREAGRWVIQEIQSSENRKAGESLQEWPAIWGAVEVWRLWHRETKYYH